MIFLSDYNSYFDAGYDDRDVVVAGYVSSVDEWSQFETEWRLTLAKYQVPYFHMKEFTSFRGPFVAPEWKYELRRAAFLSSLIGTTNTWAIFSMAFAVSRDVYSRVNQDFELDKRVNEYALCGLYCASGIRSFIRNDYKSDRPISYYFERGDKGKGMLMAEMERGGFPSPIFKKGRPKGDSSDIEDPPAIQLQASDFAAWELRRAGYDQSIGKQIRKSLRAIIAKPHAWKRIKETDLRQYCEMAGVQRRVQIGTVVVSRLSKGKPKRKVNGKK
jgi:hypothetical protein